MRRLDEVLQDIPLFAGMTPEQLALIGGCGSHAGFAAGEALFREGDPADTFYVVRHGTVAIDITEEVASIRADDRRGDGQAA